METVGLVGVGKIGLPIPENLIKSGLSTGNKQQRRTT
jgi:3-hydroxyisobutyrate dehydrogenase-like beta-hydroxyacid dehydrogenase